MNQDVSADTKQPRAVFPLVANVRQILPAVTGMAWAAGGICAATALFWLMRGYLDSGQASLLYLPIVITCAVRFGFGPAVLAALLSFFCWDFFLLPPLHTLSVKNPSDLISLIVFLVAAVLTGRLAAHARSQARDAQERLRETAILYQASRLISSEIEPNRALDTLVEHIAVTCHASHCVIFRADSCGHELAIANTAAAHPLTPEHEHLIRRSAALGGQNVVMRQGIWPGGLIAPLVFQGASLGVLSVGARSDKAPFSDQDERLILTLANHAAVVIARQHQDEQARQQAGQSAVLEERNRLANDIHDTLSHAFTGIKFLLEAALRVDSAPQAVNCVTQARQLAVEGAQEARRSVWALRPMALDEAGGLLSAVQILVTQQTAGTPLHADVTVDGDTRPLPKAIEEHLLRICQEALTNVLRHADATRIEISLTFMETRVKLTVRDNGRGFRVSPQTQHGFGLISMQERAERIGGHFDLSSQVNEGTSIIVDVPLSDTGVRPVIGTVS